MSTPLDTRHSFVATLKFYLKRLSAVPNGTDLRAAVQNDLRQITLDSSIDVSSANVTVGNPFLVGSGILAITYVPVVVSARWIGQRVPTREEWIRSLARAFLQTNTPIVRIASPDPYLTAMATAELPSALGQGADIVTAALASSSTYRNVRVDPTQTVMTHLVAAPPAAPSVVRTTDSATGQQVVTTTTPTSPTTATKTIVRTDPRTRQSTTTTEVVRYDAAADPGAGAAGQGAAGKGDLGGVLGLGRNIEIGLGVALVAGVGYWAWTRKRSKRSGASY